MKLPPGAALVVPLLLFTGCVQQLAVSTMGGLVDDGFEAFTSEGDVEFAKDALPGNLKLLEVMLKSDPDNERLLTLASEGYSSYALAFLEDTEPDRAAAMYLRGRDYAVLMLKQDEKVAAALEGSPDDLAAALRTASSDLVPAAFWTAFGWGSYIYLSQDTPDAIADLPRAEALMRFVAERDSTYYYGGADTFLGTMYGSRPRILGGDPAKSKMHFERSLRVSGGSFLMTKVYYARSYAVQMQDEELFDRLLADVESASLDSVPPARLANAIAKQKGAALKAKKSELF